MREPKNLRLAAAASFRTQRLKQAFRADELVLSRRAGPSPLFPICGVSRHETAFFPTEPQCELSVVRPPMNNLTDFPNVMILLLRLNLFFHCQVAGPHSLEMNVASLFAGPTIVFPWSGNLSTSDAALSVMDAVNPVSVRMIATDVF